MINDLLRRPLVLPTIWMPTSNATLGNTGGNLPLSSQKVSPQTVKVHARIVQTLENRNIIRREKRSSQLN